jgi:hypothetical protein
MASAWPTHRRPGPGEPPLRVHRSALQERCAAHCAVRVDCTDSAAAFIRKQLCRRPRWHTVFHTLTYNLQAHKTCLAPRIAGNGSCGAASDRRSSLPLRHPRSLRHLAVSTKGILDHAIPLETLRQALSVLTLVHWQIRGRGDNAANKRRESQRSGLRFFGNPLCTYDEPTRTAVASAHDLPSEMQERQWASPQRTMAKERAARRSIPKLAH